MCGLFGWSGSISEKQRLILAAVLSTENVRRGSDSWGFAGAKSNHWHVSKGLGNLALSTSGRQLARYRTMIGHTRQASTGAITIENSHPFKVDNLIGAHNGIVQNHDTLNLKYHRKCAVDSQHIFEHLADNIALDDIKGWGAITYTYEDQPHKVYLGRFNMGDLSVYGVESGGKRIAVLWSSEAGSAEQAAHLAGLEVFKYETKPGKGYLVQDGRLFCDKDLPVSMEKVTGSWYDSAHGARKFTSNKGTDIDNHYEDEYMYGTGEDYCSECYTYTPRANQYFMADDEMLCKECAKDPIGNDPWRNLGV